jgi:signal transduction histidine kinase
LLTWQAATQADFVLHPQPLDLAELLHTVAERFAIEAGRKQIVLHLPTGPALAQGLGDRNFVRKILENLLSNAIKFSPSGKNIYLELADTGRQLAIGVRDEGPGIRPEDQPKLFGQFQQLSARPTAGEASSGLGLYIAKRYAEAMQGDILCHSVPGQGATFTLLLPKA